MSATVFHITLVVAVADLMILWKLWKKRQDCFRAWFLLTMVPFLTIWTILFQQARKDIKVIIVIFYLINFLVLFATIFCNKFCKQK